MLAVPLKESSAMGDVVRIDRSGRLDRNAQAALTDTVGATVNTVSKGHLPDHVEIPKNKWHDWMFAGIGLSISASINVIGGAIFAEALLGNPIAAIPGAIIGAGMEAALVAAYKNEERKASFVLHLVSMFLMVISIHHLSAASIDSASKHDSDKKAALAMLQGKEKELSGLLNIDTQIASKKTSIIQLKGKKERVNGVSIWDESNGCTNGKHPRDCSNIAAMEVDLANMQSQRGDAKIEEIRAEIAGIKKENPEFWLNQGAENRDQQTILISTVDKNVIVDLRNSFAPKMDISDWINWVSLVFSAIIQLILFTVLHPMTETARLQKALKKRDQAESRVNQELNQAAREKFFKLFSWVSELGKAKAVAHGEKLAELQFEEEKRRRSKDAVLKNAVLNIKDYIKGFEPEEVKNLLLKKGAISGRDLTDARRTLNNNITKAVYWGFAEYAPGQKVQLRELGEEIQKRGMESAEFCNYKFVQKHVMGVLEKIGIVENRGTDLRANYYWVTEESLRASLASAQGVR